MNTTVKSVVFWVAMIVLVDRKVARDDRDSVPIVTTAEGEIIWVAGHVLADPFRVTPLTTSVVVLTLRR